MRGFFAIRILLKKVFLKNILRVTLIQIALRNPPQALFILRTIRWQKEAARVRSYWEQQGSHIPPMVIFSITNKCNLKCRGCYVQALHGSCRTEMSEHKLKNVIAEAKELGISLVVLGGGEPLVRQETLTITKAFPEIIFLLFTNGLLIDEMVIAELKQQRNVIPVISLEGYGEDTDKRRGEGVYEYLQRVIGKVNSTGIFFGTSLMVTRSNFATVTDDRFVQNLMGLGCRLFFFVEYTPVEEETDDWVLADEQRASLYSSIDSFRSRYPALFSTLPGDEKKAGGCLSAGRGFIHISAEGNVEPCPFAPYSDVNLMDSSLKDALQSEFLRTIRENGRKLSEREGGCALWEKREWLQSLPP
jgi:MoaA/NifB/PqqE/SkfB family radical SAM enzyme